MTACIDGQNEPFAVNIPILAFADDRSPVRRKDRAFAPRNYIVSVKPEIVLDSPFPEFGCMDSFYIDSIFFMTGIQISLL
jgi:hypothetical protein